MFALAPLKFINYKSVWTYLFQVGEGLEKFRLVEAVVAKIEPFPQNVIDIIKSCFFSKSLAIKLVPILFVSWLLKY